MLFLPFFILLVVIIGGYLEKLCLHYHPSLSTSVWLRLSTLDFYHRCKLLWVNRVLRRQLTTLADFSLSTYPTRYALYLVCTIGGFLILPCIALCLVYLLITSLLYLLAIIDWQQGMLPNSLVLLLLVTGLLLAPHFLALHYFSLLLGALLGFTSFYLLDYLYQHLYGIAGMGQGDIRLLAAIGAWSGWESLALIVFFSSASGIIYAVYRENSPWSAMLKSTIPFGTFLCLTLWVRLTVTFFSPKVFQFEFASSFIGF